MEKEALYNKSKAYYEGSGGLCAFLNIIWQHVIVQAEIEKKTVGI